MQLQRTTTDGPGTLQAWRVTTATRVFGLALVIGLTLRDGALSNALPLLATVGLIAAVCSALEWGVALRASHWTPAVEALLASLVLTNAPAEPGLFAYLAVPPIVAGIRNGVVTTVNTALVSGVTVTGMLAFVRRDTLSLLGEVAPWLVVGLGAGMLAAWQSRGSRDQDARRASYASAHQLMARLHQMARAGAVGLDSAQLASELDEELRRVTGAARSMVFVADGGGKLRPILGQDDAARLEAEVRLPDAERTPGAAVVPLRGANHVLGYCVLVGVARWTSETAARAAEVADEFALRLDTAVLFDEVRHMATSEERNRIAREMHDGVAQEIVALGYVVDEIESISNEPETRELASGLRDEISRVVTELRYSIFDLRHDMTEQELAGALTEYVQEVSRDTALRVHLVLDSTGPRLSHRTQAELMRIAQEAIGNVRRHARASNLWVTFVSNGSDVRLEIADDGVGRALPKERHWGLQTMRERAESIGANLTIEAREKGGTLVLLVSNQMASTEGSAPHEHHSSAHR